MRTEELLIYLTEKSLQPIVVLSEDATRITGRVFVLPLSNVNGLPIPFMYPARNAEEILKHFSGTNAAATFMNVIMAQPLANVPPFCLTIFGSDNKFSSRMLLNAGNIL